MLPLLFATSLRAEPAPPPIQDVREAYPVQNTDLPTNGRVVLFGPVVADMSFARFTPGEDEEFPVGHDEIRLGGTVAYVVEPGPLVAGTSLAIASRCPGCSFVVEYQVADAADDEAPVFDAGDAEITFRLVKDFLGVHVGYNVTVSLPHVADDFGAAAVLIEADEPAHRVHRVEPSRVELQTIVSARETRACFDPIAVDMAGNETPFERVCTDLDPSLAEDGGCAQTRGAPMLVALAGLVALFTRRRSRRRAP